MFQHFPTLLLEFDNVSWNKRELISIRIRYINLEEKFLYSASPSEQMLSYAELVSSIQNLKMYQSQPHGKEAIGWLDHKQPGADDAFLIHITDSYVDELIPCPIRVSNFLISK